MNALVEIQGENIIMKLAIEVTRKLHLIDRE